MAGFRTLDDIGDVAGKRVLVRVDLNVPVADGKVGPITERLMALYWKRHEDPAWSSAVRYP